MSWRHFISKLWRRVLSRPDEACERSPAHLRRGRVGEDAARQHLEALGLKYLTANFRSRRGEIDLVFLEKGCLVFAEVKTRSENSWMRPAEAVNPEKKRRLSRAALDYLRAIKNPKKPIRFDIVEVLIDDEDQIVEIRHLPNAFSLSRPYRYG